MKTPILIKKSRVPIYGTRLWVVVTKNIPKGIDLVEDKIDHKIMTDTDKKGVRALMYAYVNQKGRMETFIFLNPTAKPGTIAHECKHLVNIIFHWSGVKLSTSNDESECYYLDKIVDLAHNAIKHYKKINK